MAVPKIRVQQLEMAGGSRFQTNGTYKEREGRNSRSTCRTCCIVVNKFRGPGTPYQSWQQKGGGAGTRRMPPSHSPGFHTNARYSHRGGWLCRTSRTPLHTPPLPPPPAQRAAENTQQPRVRMCLLTRTHTPRASTAFTRHPTT